MTGKIIEVIVCRTIFPKVLLHQNEQQYHPLLYWYLIPLVNHYRCIVYCAISLLQLANASLQTRPGEKQSVLPVLSIERDLLFHSPKRIQYISSYHNVRLYRLHPGVTGEKILAWEVSVLTGSRYRQETNHSHCWYFSS